MNYLSVDNLAKHYGERTLFEGISFGLSRGDKVALIANNGTGKSTLLKILAGKDIADGGIFSLREGVRMVYLEQEPVFETHASQTIADFVQEASAEVLQIIRSYQLALKASESGREEDMRQLERASASMDARQAWDFDRRLTTMLGRFGIHDLQQRVGTLSGGQKKRLAIALTILDQPDMLLLDEPTNHLDVEMVEWLEQYLMQANITLLMVTHDRYFLDRVCNQILEMSNGTLYRHMGNYEYFLEKRAQREEVFGTAIEKANRLMKKELEWMRRQPKARTTKSKARIEAFYDTKAKAESGRKQAELKLDVKMTRIGGKILELKKVYKSYGDRAILKGFDYTFKRGERIGIIGQNGVGKTTFLNIITGSEEVDSGKVNTGETIVYGYYSQSGLELKTDKRVIEVLKDIAEVIQLSDGSKLSAAQFLQFFLFPPEMQYTYVSKLSGGERRRLQLLCVLMKNPNFLILDEPTNDLDLLTLQKLEEFLEGYGGCLVIVSHDRYFMDRLVDHLFIFQGDAQVRDFWGPYSEWKEVREAEEEQRQKSQMASSTQSTAAASKTPPSENPKAANVVRQKLSFKEQYELQALDTEIPLLEARKSTLEAQLATAGSDFESLQRWSEELNAVSDEIDEKTMRWLELDERRG